MNLTLVAILGVVSIVAVTAFSKKLGLAAPLALVVVGIVLSFVPGTPDVEIDPELILAGVLPPLLYSSAVDMPSQDFRRNLKAISSLAVLLVILTTLGMGWMFHTILPGVGWPAAFALGAVISPTDAVAATSIGKKLGLPPRVVTMLEGEGLVNDASSLVLLRSAVAAIASSVSIWQVAGSFVRSVVIAVIVGVVVGEAAVRLRALLRDPVLGTAVSFVVPFVAFLPAEELDASGVLAVVVTGLVVGRLGPRRIAARDRWLESMNWRTIAFLMESAIFLIMGLEVKPLVDAVQRSDNSLSEALWVGLLASAAVVALRLVFVVPLVGAIRQDQQRAAGNRSKFENWQDNPRFNELEVSERRLQRMSDRVERVVADLDFKVTEAIGWRSAVVLGWAGMRGAITVAAAQTLPLDTPRREELVLIAFVVAVVTLLAQGLTLPLVIRKAGIRDDSAQRVQQETHDVVSDLYAAGFRELDELERTASEEDRSTLAEIRHDLERERDEMGARADLVARDARHDYSRLRLDVLAAQRNALNSLADRGAYGSPAINAATRMLDGFEVRLTSFDDDSSA
ncbi:sodium:proton antiporter [Flexivirga sp. ID2601S]|uniref:Sodium:proton antiporter n=1 Tax=Flexivirga aerilata TaxID=1656889 RepID=A0A849AK74_9MICO|nr:sodium:proton antiporter [Flexivirga aerilata]NNG39711.1 sodium:proton antiporter [Flexivirga aerilata]